MTVSFGRRFLLLLITLSTMSINVIAQNNIGMISGKALSPDGDAIDYATVALEGTSYSCPTNEKGLYLINAPEGAYSLVITSVGFEKCEIPVTVKSGKRTKLNVKQKPAYRQT